MYSKSFGLTNTQLTGLKALGIDEMPVTYLQLGQLLSAKKKEYEMAHIETKLGKCGKGRNKETECNRFTLEAAEKLGFSEVRVQTLIRAAILTQKFPDLRNSKGIKPLLRKYAELNPRPQRIKDAKGLCVPITYEWMAPVVMEPLGTQCEWSMAKAFSVFWQLHGQLKRSANNYKSLMNHLYTFFKDLKVHDVNYLHVERFRFERQKSVAASTVNREHTVLTTLFHKLKLWKRIAAIPHVRLPEENPGPLVKKKDERGFSRKRVLSGDEVARLLSASDHELQRIILFAINTGLRRRDLMLASKENVNLSMDTIEGIQSKVGKPYRIPLNDISRRIVAEAKGPRLFDFRNFKRRWERASQRAGIEHFEFRDLRRTFARRLLSSGADLAIVQKMLGHSSLAMTGRYVPPRHEETVEAMNRIANSFSVGPRPQPTKIELHVA